MANSLYVDWNYIIAPDIRGAATRKTPLMHKMQGNG